jgi:hypothetical protein
VDTSVGRVFVFLFFFLTSRVQVLKKIKELPGSSSFILGDLKNHLGPGFKNPKRGSYEVGQWLEHVINRV